MDSNNISIVAYGGEPAPGLQLVITESWNGTNWTEANAYEVTGRLQELGSAGTTNTGSSFSLAWWSIYTWSHSTLHEEF